jgi:hypothetical protein
VHHGATYARHTGFLRHTCRPWLVEGVMKVLLALLASAAAACAGDPTDRPATWSYVHAAVIVPSCATSSCHSARTAVGGIALEDADTAYDVLLGLPDGAGYVTPGDPSSTLLLLLAGDERQRMPPDAPLPAADIDLVRAWIEAGAAR